MISTWKSQLRINMQMLGQFRQPMQRSLGNALSTTFPSIFFMRQQAKQSAKKTASWELPFISISYKQGAAVWLASPG